MNKIVFQVQLLLAALSALLPLVPVSHRGRVAEILQVAASALSFGGALAGNIDDLSVKLAAIRAEVEEMAAAGREIGAAELDAAMTRVRIASADFRGASAGT
ncbi:MAG: hypothetical protein H7124_17340 [Phycisphaerales bacterium]|nr:hypothetical protein [Hyphomonadaceae bacterium]